MPCSPRLLRASKGVEKGASKGPLRDYAGSCEVHCVRLLLTPTDEAKIAALVKRAVG